MYHYVAYGLHIISDLLLPELQASQNDKADVDLVIHRGKIDCNLPMPFESWDYFHLDGDTAYLCWKIVGKFQVCSGKEIIIEPFADVKEHLIRLPLLGSVLAMALHQRQFLVLHGSAVAIEDGAAIFVGASGQGKSTMAATLCSRGHQLASDDVAALQINTEKCNLIPGFPQMKLWSETARAILGDEAENLKPIHPEVDKLARPTVDNFYSRPLPLKAIFLLRKGEVIRITSLKPQAAMTTLIANSFIPMLIGNKFQKDKLTAFHFYQCLKLINIVPIYILERPCSLNLLPNVADLIENLFKTPVNL